VTCVREGMLTGWDKEGSYPCAVIERRTVSHLFCLRVMRESSLHYIVPLGLPVGSSIPPACHLHVALGTTTALNQRQTFRVNNKQVGPRS
jgi:hypothetical protein